MSTEKHDYSLDSREAYILGQALQIAITELKKVNEPFLEYSNIRDMEDLQKMFPFQGIEKEYKFKVIIDLKNNDNDIIKKLEQLTQENRVDCKFLGLQQF